MPWSGIWNSSNIDSNTQWYSNFKLFPAMCEYTSFHFLQLVKMLSFILLIQCYTPYFGSLWKIHLLEKWPPSWYSASVQSRVKWFLKLTILRYFWFGKKFLRLVKKRYLSLFWVVSSLFGVFFPKNWVTALLRGKYFFLEIIYSGFKKNREFYADLKN